MNEEEKPQEIQEQAKGQPEETPTQTLYEKTEVIVSAQKAENDRREALIAREEALYARKQLAGYTEAGQGQPKETEAEKMGNEIADAFR